MKNFKLLKLNWSKIIFITLLVFLFGAPSVFSSYPQEEVIGPNRDIQSFVVATIQNAKKIGEFLYERTIIVFDESEENFILTVKKGISFFTSIFCPKTIQPTTKIKEPTFPTTVPVVPTSTIIEQINQAGLVGSIGPKGDTGPVGQIGPRGLTGLRGPKGDKGESGESVNVDTSYFVTKIFFDNQINRIFDAINNGDENNNDDSSPLVSGTDIKTINGISILGSGNIDIAGGEGSMTYPGAGIPISTGSAWGGSITNNSSNWNTAYSQTRQWNGGNTGLVATTGRTSLGLGSAALSATGDFAPAFTSRTANYFFATPNGSSGVPSLRAIVAADIPTLNQNTLGYAGNLSGGAGGEILYQSASNTTGRLGNGTVGQVLTSQGTTLAPEWTTLTGGGMVYPGAGIPISTGSAWGGSITNNSSNWNTAYGWGNPSGVYLPIASQAADSALLQGHNAAYFQIAGSYQPLATVLTNTTASYTTAINTRLTNTSGTNTGNETATTIKTALGISTLSGSNTGDQTLSGLGGQPSDADLTSISNLTNATGFLYNNGSGAFSYQAAGAGDMVLSGIQTVTGAKTFNDGKLLLRNVANDYNGSFTNTNTADRVYTLKNASGTLAFTSDITGTNSGTNTGDQTTVTGNAGTATALQNARSIFGISFNGTTDIGSALGTGAYATIANYAPLASPTFTGTVSGITAAMVGLGSVPNLTFSGSNTGDETATTIKTALGISTLSGSNTGDQTLSGLGGQPSDADLTAIAALAGASGFLKKTAADTWALDMNTYLTSSTGVSSFSGGTTGLTPASATSGTITLAGILVSTNGGTGYSSYAVGDMLYAGTTTSLSKLVDVSAGQPLLSGGISTAPGYAGYTFLGTAAQTYTFPASSGILATLAGSEALTNKSVNGVTLSTGAGAGNYLSGDGSYDPITSSQWTTSTSDIYYNTGRVFIGASSEAISSSRLYLSGTTSGNGLSSAIAGVLGDYTFNPTGGGIQVGNRFVINNSPTIVANTAVGEVIRVIDNSTLDNLVRGVDIMSNNGSNTAGTNTGLRASGATFGVQGITNALAGGDSVPAALYGESTGTIQGDILRLYSKTMTSATSFATFYHDTSSFSGTGLLMDFATGSGTFSGNFVDFYKDNIPLFRVTNGGVVSMGLGSTAATSAVCSSLAPGSAPAADMAYEIRDCSSTPIADYAEMYPVETDSNYGDIMIVGDELVETFGAGEDGAIDWNKAKGSITRLVKSNKPYQRSVIGVVSDNHGDFSSVGYNIKSEDNPKPIALSGRVPVKVSPSSESIKAGDYLTTSEDAGMATKALKSGFVIGKALEDWTKDSGKETVMFFVEQGFYNSDLDGTLSVEKEMTVDGLTYINATKEFAESIIFNNMVEFTLPPLFNNDTAGFAIIKEGSDRVEVIFDKPYIASPVVSVTVSFDEGIVSEEQINQFFEEKVDSIVTNKTQNGFTIRINKKAVNDIHFSWIALSVKDPKIFESVIEGLNIEQDGVGGGAGEDQATGVVGGGITGEDIINNLLGNNLIQNLLGGGENNLNNSGEGNTEGSPQVQTEENIPPLEIINTTEEKIITEEKKGIPMVEEKNILEKTPSEGITQDPSSSSSQEGSVSAGEPAS